MILQKQKKTGTVQASYAYSPYGQMTAKSGTIDSAHRYAGGYYDPATTLYKFGARYYNPTDKRWTQLDNKVQPLTDA